MFLVSIPFLGEISRNRIKVYLRHGGGGGGDYIWVLDDRSSTG